MLLCTPALRHCCLPCLSHVTVATAAMVQGAKVVVTWETSSPYQPVLHCTSGCHAAIRGITLRHASPSVADNYAVHLQVCLLSAGLLLRQARCGSAAQRAASCLQYCLICAKMRIACASWPLLIGARSCVSMWPRLSSIKMQRRISWLCTGPLPRTSRPNVREMQDLMQG